MHTPETFGQRLRRTREAKDMSVETLAGLCRVRVITIERWEAGVTKDPPLDLAGRAAKALEVSLDYLAGVEVAA